MHMHTRAHIHILKTAVPLPVTTHEDVQANRVIERPLPSKMTSYTECFGAEFYRKERKPTGIFPTISADDSAEERRGSHISRVNPVWQMPRGVCVRPLISCDTCNTAGTCWIFLYRLSGIAKNTLLVELYH